jgi:protein ImuB
VLWISVYLPELSLQSHARGALGHMQAVPLVISDGVSSRPHVHAANACAREAGITTLMPVAAAQARAAQLLVVPREPAKEQETLQDIATWLAQFTPMVCPEKSGASLEIASTLRLFGGIGQLANRIRAGMPSLGLHAAIGIAPTPLAAYLLARASHYMTGIRMCRDPQQLHQRLADIPLVLFDWPHDIVQPLAALGLVRVKDLLSQPRTGLRRRFGDQVLDDLDRALGQLADPREPHRVPEDFSSSTDLLFDIIDAERLFIPVRMLLNHMEGFLRARGAAANEIVLDLKHNRTLKTHHEFGARHPLRSAGEWLRLIRERLTAHPFPEAVVALKLSAPNLVAFQEQNESWLPTPDIRQEKWQALIERVASRLGDKSVFRVQENSDHRPEYAWRPDIDRKTTSRLPRITPDKPRPLLLLTEPRALATLNGAPQHHGELSLLAGPERIETGWWDGRPVARDYFVAKNPQQEICWVFRDYRLGKKWYLHGYFS